MKLVLFFLLLIPTPSAFSQGGETFYPVNAKWKITGTQSPKYNLWVHQNMAGEWEYDYYQPRGPLVKVETHKYRKDTTLNGQARYYSEDGNLDSAGHYENGKKDGEFYRYAIRHKNGAWPSVTYEYLHDSLIKTTDMTADSIAQHNDRDSSETSSTFPGGREQWTKYVQQNMDYPSDAARNEIQGTVWLLFQIDEQGNVLDPCISRSVEHSLDREAIRVVLNSGKWQPALKNGKPILSYRRMPITFRLFAQ